MKTARLLLSGLLLSLVLLGPACAKGKPEQGGQRLVALSPEVAEIISALGAGDELVGLTEECDYPPELANIRKVGKFGSVDREAILGLKPDLVFTSALEQDALAQELKKLGLRVEQIYPRGLDDLPASVRQIGALIGRDEQAAALADSMAREIAQMRAQKSGQDRPKVYVEIYRDPLMSVADASFVGEVVECAGGDNIFATLERDYARVRAEDVVASAPDIMICFSQDTVEGIRARKGWQDIPALRNSRIYFEADLDPDWLLQATPRTIQGLKRLREIFRQGL